MHLKGTFLFVHWGCMFTPAGPDIVISICIFELSMFEALLLLGEPQELRAFPGFFKWGCTGSLKTGP